MVITTNNVGDAEINVIDHRGQRIEVGAILAHQYRIGHRGKIHRLRAADQIVPMHLSTLGVKRIGIEIWQQETPMGLAPLRLEGCFLFVRELQALAAINGWQATREAKLTTTLQLIRRFVAGIKQPGLLQLFDRPAVDIETFRLILHAIRFDAQPIKIDCNCLRILVPGAFNISVVIAQNELAAILLREEPV